MMYNQSVCHFCHVHILLSVCYINHVTSSLTNILFYFTNILY